MDGELTLGAWAILTSSFPPRYKRYDSRHLSSVHSVYSEFLINISVNVPVCVYSSMQGLTFVGWVALRVQPRRRLVGFCPINRKEP